MNENELATAMQFLLEEQREDLCLALEEQADAEGDEAPVVEGFAGYREAGVMTTDAGFVVRMQDGAEYQVTVVRSR